MDGVKIYSKDYCAACYFRTTAKYPEKKCLIQLTERCNLHCEHCFVSAESGGDEIDFEKIERNILPQLKKNRVTKVTLTGGEPFAYSRLAEVVSLLSGQGISVGICTNASLITEAFLDEMEGCKVHFNVSLDGFSADSHGKFRGNTSPELFERIKQNVRLLGEKRRLNGILVTPNIFATISEYVDICEFAKQCGAKYVLMNPLSQFGRGEDGISVAFSEKQMSQLRMETEKYNDGELEIVYIRFPNQERKPLGECVAGKIMYIFTNGDIAYCPYMVFAAGNSMSKYSDRQFMIGNIFEEGFDWEKAVRNYRFPVSYDETCAGCTNSACKKGCYAAKISGGKMLSDMDAELCPLNLDKVEN